MHAKAIQITMPVLLLVLIYALAIAARLPLPLLYASAITLVVWKALRNLDHSRDRRIAERSMTKGARPMGGTGL